jgi:pimeloyl-ACP methyl ester carboxylesterase
MREMLTAMQALEDRYIKIGNINTRFWSTGENGTPVVFVHGLGGSMENWVYNIEPLAGQHRVYALDLKGFGRTDKTPFLKDLQELVQFLGDFMEILHIEKATLVGNSLGGGLVLSFAYLYPEKTDKLVLVDTSGMGREVNNDLKLVSIPVIGELFAKVSRKRIAGLWREIVFDPSLVTDELVEQTFALATLPGAHKALLVTLRAGINIRGQRGYLIRQLLCNIGGIACPVLVFWGRQDRIIPVSHARIAGAKIPNVRVEIFENCGHMPQLEYPDRFNKLVLEFLAE